MGEEDREVERGREKEKRERRERGERGGESENLKQIK